MRSTSDLVLRFLPAEGLMIRPEGPVGGPPGRHGPDRLHDGGLPVEVEVAAVHRRGLGDALEDHVLQQRQDIGLAFTEKAGDARQIAQAAAERGQAVRLYACGGDGTLNDSRARI